MSPPKRVSGAIAKLDKYRHEERDLAEEDCVAPLPEEDTVRVLEAISLCQITPTLKIEEVKVDISLIRQDMHKLRERVMETERRVSKVEDGLPPLRITTERLQHQLNSILHKQDDMETRLQCCNFRFVGLPERAKGSELTYLLGIPVV